MKNELKAIIYAPYVGVVKITLKDDFELSGYSSTTLDYGDCGALRMDEKAYDGCFINVKDLSKLTQEDAKKLLSVTNLGFHAHPTHIEEIKISNDILVIRHSFGGQPYTDHIPTKGMLDKQHQLLIQLGYGVNQTVMAKDELVTYTVKQLVELGIYKLI